MIDIHYPNCAMYFKINHILQFTYSLCLLMKSIINSVLSLYEVIQNATSIYIDDVYVNESTVSVPEIRKHISDFNLICKGPERLKDRVKVLGLQVWSTIYFSENEQVTIWRSQLLSHIRICSLCIGTSWVTFWYASRLW